MIPLRGRWGRQSVLTPTSGPGAGARWLRRLRKGLEHPLLTTGDLLIKRDVRSTVRFREGERFGSEIGDRREFIRRAFQYLSFNGIEGSYAEFGSHTGITFRIAWSASRLFGLGTHLWAFDSFSGLPPGSDEADVHPRWEERTLATGVAEFHEICRSAGIAPADYSVVPGYYSTTLAGRTEADAPKAVSFAYVDCDLHSSTLDVLRFLEPRLVPSAVLAFDDYFCYSPDGPSGERLACAEHFATSRWRLVPYIQYGWSGMSFVVEAVGDGDLPAGP